jgi:hypothetical protein
MSADHRDAPARRAYLSICAIYRDEADYLAEWIAFHRLVGVERFFLYNNNSVDAHADVLESFISDGIVTVHDWPQFPGQTGAYEHCLRNHGHETRWMAFIDLDEFLFSPTYAPLPAVLVDYETYPAVVVHWATFGTSGHRTKQPGLVIETYVRRAREEDGVNLFFKSIVDPARTIAPLGDNPHVFSYTAGYAVDEDTRPVPRGAGGVLPVCFSRLRLNHYLTKSEEQWREKLAKPLACNGEPRKNSFVAKWQVDLNEVVDETITAYVPALTEMLAKQPALPSR